MADLDAMLEAHVQFELNRWVGSAAEASIAEEVAAWYTWIAGRTLADLVDSDALVAAVTTQLCDGDLPAEVPASLLQATVLGYSEAVAEDSPVADFVTREHYDQLAETVIGMTELRAEITAQITTSEVYAQLLAHVLYQGIKNYLASENVIARKVPGASTLMRLGQNAMNSAAPKLEASIDRQLTSFVNSNISDTIRDSRHYLDKVLDAEVLGAVANEIWETNSEITVSRFVQLIPSTAVVDLTALGWRAFLVARSTANFRAHLSTLLAELLADQVDRDLSVILREAGLDEESVTALATVVLLPVVTEAQRTGFTEARIRARLTPFYETYGGPIPE